jgi:hypothetical protein
LPGAPPGTDVANSNAIIRAGPVLPSQNVRGNDCDGHHTTSGSRQGLEEKRASIVLTGTLHHRPHQVLEVGSITCHVTDKAVITI